MNYRQRLQVTRIKRMLEILEENGEDQPMSAETLASVYVARHGGQGKVSATTVYYLMGILADTDEVETPVVSFPGPGGGFMITTNADDIREYKRMRIQIILTMLRRTLNRVINPFLRRFVEPSNPDQAQRVRESIETAIREVARIG